MPVDNNAALQEATLLAQDAIKLMTWFHSHSEPDDTPDQNALFPAEEFRQFVDGHAKLMFRLAQLKKVEVVPAFTRLRNAANDLTAHIGAYGSIGSRHELTEKLVNALYGTDDGLPEAAIAHIQAAPVANEPAERGTVDWLITMLQSLKAGGVSGANIVAINDATFGKCQVGGAVFGGDAGIVELQADDDAKSLEQEDCFCPVCKAATDHIVDANKMVPNDEQYRHMIDLLRKICESENYQSRCRNADLLGDKIRRLSTAANAVKDAG